MKRKSRHRSGTPVRPNPPLTILAGSEKYRSITTGHYRFALGAILVYDVTNRESFTNCKYWVDNIRQYADESVVIALVGNKADVANLTGYKRKVTMQEAMEFA
jgi:GTPase SAR1 family protein